MGSPTWSRLVVSRALELKDKGTNTGLGLGLVAEMNLVELALVMVYDGGICGLGLVVVYELRLVVVWTRIGDGIWTRIGGGIWTQRSSR